MTAFEPTVEDAPLEDLAELAASMREGLKSVIKDRSHRLRTYRCCFPGKAGVRWLVCNGHAADEEEALSVGNALLQAGLLHHVAYEHTFKANDLLYKFTMDDDSSAHADLARVKGVGSMRSGATTPTSRQPGTPNSTVSSLRHERGALHARGSAPAPGAAGHHAHRALLNAQVQSLNAKLERLAVQHATLVASNAQQQEAWEGQTSGDLREIREAIGQLAATLAPTQRQVLQLGAQVTQLQGQLHGQRAMSAVQQVILTIAVLALGTGWAPSALWALSAAAAAALLAVWMNLGADNEPRSAAVMEGVSARQLAMQQSAALREYRTAHGAAADAAVGIPAVLGPLHPQAEMDVIKPGAGGAPGLPGAPRPLRVLATASEGSADVAPPPMSEEAQQLQAQNVFGGKTVDETMPATSEFDAWPDGRLMLRPSPRGGDTAVTRMERYVSSSYPCVPTDAHRRWEAAQAKWRAVAAEADADDDADPRDQGAAAAEGPEAWVPAPGAPLPVNQYVVHFENDIFVGKFVILIKDLPSSYEPYFTGKKRRSVMLLQGRFKAPLAVDDVVTGQEFWRPYKNLRGCWLMERIVLAFAKRVVSAMEVGDMTKEPFITFPLLPLAHQVNVSMPGQEPPLDDAPEDLRLWDPTLVDKHGNPLAADTRRRHFMSDKWRKGRRFSTEHVWTFYIWQQVIDVPGLFLDLVVQQYDIIQHLDGMPLQAMIKDKASGKYLCHMVYWNKKQIEVLQETRRAEAEAAGAAAAVAAAQ